MGVLFWFVLKAILSSLIGQSFYKWFKTTKYGVWWDAKISALLNKVTNKHEEAELKVKDKWSIYLLNIQKK